MGRKYAGVLGFLAFLTVVGRGLIKGGSLESTLQIAILMMFALAIVGYIVGELAAWVVEESVRSQLASELAEHSAETKQEALK